MLDRDTFCREVNSPLETTSSFLKLHREALFTNLFCESDNYEDYKFMLLCFVMFDFLFAVVCAIGERSNR